MPCGAATLPRSSPTRGITLFSDGKHLLMNHLDIEVPMIAAVNGPALIHAELALLCDVVIAAENAEFQDLPHFPGGLVPGDGVHVVFPLLMGFNRGRYFLLTGQKISARQALDMGLVSEVMARDKLRAAGLGTGASDHPEAPAGGALCAPGFDHAPKTADAGQFEFRTGVGRTGGGRTLGLDSAPR